MLGILSVLLAFATLPSNSVAFPSPDSSNEVSHTLATRDNPLKAYAWKYQKNCQGKAALETEAWDTAQKLAAAAKGWHKGSTWQTTADFWFGTDSANYYDRIIKNFNNAFDFHDTSWFWTPNAQQGAYYEVWCKEDGPDGFVPRPDGAKGDWKPGKAGCTPGTNMYSFQRSRWWWLQGTVYYTVFCDNAWDETTPNKGKRTLQVIEDEIKKKFPQGKQDGLTMELPNMIRGASYLHEILHHEVVSNPNVIDINIPGPRWMPDKGMEVYGPMWSAALAKWQGVLQTGLEDPPKGGGYNGEFGSALNSDNYVNFALSVYFQELLDRASPIEPEDQAWKDSKKKGETAPNRFRNLDISGFIARGPDPPSDAEVTDSAFIPVANEIHADVPVDPEYTSTTDETHYPTPPENPPICQAPGSDLNAGAAPNLVNVLGAIYCSKWPPKKQDSLYPIQLSQPMQETLTEKDLKPTDKDAPGAKLNVTFDFQPGPALAGCFIGCADMYPELIQTCQFNSHNIVGKSMLVQECGNFTITINPPGA